MTSVANVTPYPVILALSNVPSTYSPVPPYGQVTVLPSALGGGCEYQIGTTSVTQSDVDDDFWAAWSEENSANPLLVNEQIFET